MGRAEFGLKFVQTFRADFRPAYKIFSQRRTHLSPVSVDAIDLINLSINKTSNKIQTVHFVVAVENTTYYQLFHK